LIAVNVKPEHGGGLGPVVGGEDHLPAEGEAVQTVFCDSDSIYLVTHSLRLLLANCITWIQVSLEF